MKLAVPLAVAALSIASARVTREVAIGARLADDVVRAPYAPSTSSAPFLALGYRELVADLLWVRFRGYYGGWYDTTSDGVASIVEAVVALDPKFLRAYELGANAMTIADKGVDQASFVRAIALLERGMTEFPASSSLPLLAGQLYLQDLKTDDPAQRRAWDERGVLLVESAIRKPGAMMTQSAAWVAHIRSKLGQRDRAVQGLRELLLVTNDPKLRVDLLGRLAKLEETDSADIAAELFESRKQFEAAWQAQRPAVPFTTYLLLGPPVTPGFDLTELATGGQDLIGAEAFERLEPLTDSPTQTAPTPAPTP